MKKIKEDLDESESSEMGLAGDLHESVRNVVNQFHFEKVLGAERA